MNYLIKIGVFLLLVIIYVPQILLDSGFCCCFDSGNLLRFTKMVKYLPEFEYFTVFLKNRNFISKTKRSKVTDSAALKSVIFFSFLNN